MAAGQDQELLLRRHVPEYRYDSGEEDPAATITAPGRWSREPGPVYGRVVRRGADAWLQYWSFYPDNPQDRGIVRTGRHVGDWELVQLNLADGRPRSATYAQHAWAMTCAWDGRRPKVFVSSGSHAAYFTSGRHERPFPDPNDFADGTRAVAPRVEPLGDWVDWPGRWGPTREGWVPGEQSSPRSPAFQGVRWDDPAAFERSGRRCGAAPPWQWTETVTPLVLGLAALVAALALVKRRRRGV